MLNCDNSCSTAKPRLHILGMAHTRFTDEYSHCSFTTLTRRFCNMMYSHGYEVFVYGTSGSQVECTVFIGCLEEIVFEKYFSQKKSNSEYHSPGNLFQEGWALFNKKCETELRHRIKKNDIVIIHYEDYHKFAFDIPEAITVDAHYGLMKPKYTVYPSKTWRSYMYGLSIRDTMLQTVTPPYWNDAVIYHYLDLKHFPFHDLKDDYAVFLGKVVTTKGVYDVIRLCQEKGVKLKIAGSVSEDIQEDFHDYLKEHPAVEYMGVLNADQRTRLIGKAKCLFCPTYHLEPFGLIAIEAMASGTPVIATDWGGFSETVIHGKTGFLISHYSDMENALDNIGQISHHDCRKWVEANFTTSVAFEYYDRFFKRIMVIESCEGNSWYTAKLSGDGPISQTLVHPW